MPKILKKKQPKGLRDLRSLEPAIAIRRPFSRSLHADLDSGLSGPICESNISAEGLKSFADLALNHSNRCQHVSNVFKLSRILNWFAVCPFEVSTCQDV